MVKNAERIDWLKVKNEYINSHISYRKLSDKYCISLSSVSKKALSENWQNERKKQCNKITTKVLQKTEDKIVKNELAKIDRVAKAKERLIDKLEEATEQLNNYIVTCKQTQTTTKYDNKTNKPKKQIVKETANIQILEGTVDNLGLKRITGALRDIQAIGISAGESTSGEPTLEELLSMVAGDEY